MTKFAPLMWGTESTCGYTASNNLTLVANGDVEGNERVDLMYARMGVDGVGSLTVRGFNVLKRGLGGGWAQLTPAAPAIQHKNDQRLLETILFN
jgi:hypothetical protein